MGAAASVQMKESKMSDSCRTFCRLFCKMAGRDEEGQAARVMGWMAADPNGNGHMSLAECDGWIQKALRVHFASGGTENKEEADRIWKAFRPSYIRAFNDAKDLVGGKNKGESENYDFVEKKEFRGLVSYLCLYAVMYDAFALVDGGGGDVDDKTGDDRKMSPEEWKTGYKKVGNHGFAGLKKAMEEGDSHADEIFAQMDKDKKGAVTLTEFCLWIEKNEVDAGTEWGKLLAAGDNA